ncbi:uncharacterized protein [Oscarella lobularis]|uniref:uncharacterized protein n=1 Tax=Oscarella lobularis TaxID=121494 RepID=UPI0033136263
MCVRLLFAFLIVLLLTKGINSCSQDRGKNRCYRKSASNATHFVYDCTTENGSIACSCAKQITGHIDGDSMQITVTVNCTAQKIDVLEFLDKDTFDKFPCVPPNKKWHNVNGTTRCAIELKRGIQYEANVYFVHTRDPCPCGDIGNDVEFSDNDVEFSDKWKPPPGPPSIAMPSTTTTTPTTTTMIIPTSNDPPTTSPPTSIIPKSSPATSSPTFTTSNATSNTPPTPKPESASVILVVALTTSIMLVCVTAVAIMLCVLRRKILPTVDTHNGERDDVAASDETENEMMSPHRVVYVVHVQYPDGKNGKIQKLCECLREYNIKCQSKLINQNAIAERGYHDAIRDYLERADIILVCLDAEMNRYWTTEPVLSCEIEALELKHEINYIKVIEHSNNSYKRLVFVLMEGESESTVPNEPILKGVQHYKQTNSDDLVARILGENRYVCDKRPYNETFFRVQKSHSSDVILNCGGSLHHESAV